MYLRSTYIRTVLYIPAKLYCSVLFVHRVKVVSSRLSMSYRTYAVCRCKSCSYLGYNPGLFGGTGTAVYRSTSTQINERPLDLLSRPVANKSWLLSGCANVSVI